MRFSSIINSCKCNHSPDIARARGESVWPKRRDEAPVNDSVTEPSGVLTTARAQVPSIRAQTQSVGDREQEKEFHTRPAILL